jgi:hypothetical protein
MEEETCALCSEPMLDESYTWTTRCGHRFHALCVAAFVPTKDPCPTCCALLVYDPRTVFRGNPQTEALGYINSEDPAEAEVWTSLLVPDPLGGVPFVGMCIGKTSSLCLSADLNPRLRNAATNMMHNQSTFL